MRHDISHIGPPRHTIHVEHMGSCFVLLLCHDAFSRPFRSSSLSTIHGIVHKFTFLGVNCPAKNSQEMPPMARPKKKGKNKEEKPDGVEDEDEVDEEESESNIDIIVNGPAYQPKYPRSVPMTPRDSNPVVFIEITAGGGVRQLDGLMTLPRVLGRLFFELRNDIAPVCSANFLMLIKGGLGVSLKDSVRYHYKGTKIHRVVKDKLLQGGDLLDEYGHCSRSTYKDGSLFADENFILRHTGPGCLSMCNRGPDTNGSLFQVTLTAQETLDGLCCVFGCLCTDESYRVLESISYFGTTYGKPTEELTISACDVVFPPNA